MDANTRNVGPTYTNGMKEGCAMLLMFKILTVLLLVFMAGCTPF
jgi:hypothetical protein